MLKPLSKKGQAFGRNLRRRVPQFLPGSPVRILSSEGWRAAAAWIACHNAAWQLPLQIVPREGTRARVDFTVMLRWSTPCHRRRGVSLANKDNILLPVAQKDDLFLPLAKRIRGR